MENNPELMEIVLRDLQPVLRGKLGDSLIVESFTTESLLPPGENYGSTILSVHAVIRRNSDAEKEDLYLIAKMPPPTEFQRRVFDSPTTFRKEIFMYENLLPSYQQLEMEYGVKKDEVFHVAPKCYGWRLSLDPKLDFDDNAVILLENLKSQGYYTGARDEGYDYEHSKLAIRALARFHALGMAMKYKKPDYFETLKVRAKSISVENSEFKDLNLALLKRMETDPEMKIHHDRCRKALTELSIEVLWTGIPEEPWSTIVHSDFWVNNIMFHTGENGVVDDVKFVDFQNYLFLSPVRELVFFIFLSAQESVQNEHADDLIDMYYETFINVLTEMKCDIEPFSRDKFDAKVASDAKLEFMHICFMLKVVTLNVKETNFNYDKIQSVMVEYEGNDECLRRLRHLVKTFAQRDWI